MFMAKSARSTECTATSESANLFAAASNPAAAASNPAAARSNPTAATGNPPAATGNPPAATGNPPAATENPTEPKKPDHEATDPVIKFKRSVRQFFDDKTLGRTAEIGLTRSEALELVKAVHDDRKKATMADKSRIMMESALKRARLDIDRLQEDVVQKDRTILALQDANRELWSSNSAMSQKMSNLKSVVRDTQQSVMSITNIVESFAAAMAATDPGEEDTQTWEHL